MEPISSSATFSMIRLISASASWETVFERPVRSLAVLDEVIALGTYDGTYVLRPGEPAARVQAEPTPGDSPWAGTVFTLAADAGTGRFYEGRDRALEVATFDVQGGDWHALPPFPDAERWTVWSVAIREGILYAGTGKGVWVLATGAEGGTWAWIGPPL